MSYGKIQIHKTMEVLKKKNTKNDVNPWLI